MPLRAVIVAFLVGAMLLAVSPVFAAPPGGTGPGDAVPLVGTQSGTLATGADFWYTFFDSGTSSPLGVTLNYSPSDIDTAPDKNPMVSFDVWDYEKVGLDLILTQIGRGTISNQPMGVKYWAGGSNVARTYYVRVFNNAPATISYAIAFTGATFPPPTLQIAPSAPAAPVPAPVPPAPPAPPPAPLPTGTGTSMDNAIPITGVMTGTIATQHVWYTFFYTGSNLDEGLVLDFAPATVEDPMLNQNFVAFNVWTNVCNITPGSGCQQMVVGAGTRSGQPGGVKYWRHSGGEGRTYFIEVFNNSGQTVGYALALTGDLYPPPGLPVPLP
ncbi:MAG: hypothetical protein M1380_08475 [Chloroflexi bacterium]|nr:hypothetical protein [Chloroflexota bacterium]